MIDIQTFELPYNAVHLWVVHFKTLSNIYLLRDDLLSEEEKARKGRFATHELQEKFFLSRAILKLLLAKYLNISPSKIHYKYGLFHKPFVNSKYKALSFNISHSSEWAAYAFFHGDSVGVDIEEHSREISSVIDLSYLICNKEEQKQLQAIACPEKRKTYFMYIWTAREAFLKMIGIGIGNNLSSIHFDESWNAFLPNTQDFDRCGYMMMGRIQHFVHKPYIVSIASSRNPEQIIEYKLQNIADLGF